jgi:formate dehydrogenase subunit gamma
MNKTESRLLRFTFRERAIHWGVAAFFLYSAFTGLSLWSPYLYWLSTVFGGGEAVRWGHPWGGVAFVLVLGAMFLNWSRDMRLQAEDKTWLRSAHRYAVHDDSALPEPGRFNAGQKMLFWSQSAAAFLLLGSGAVLWFPEATARELRLAAVLVHPLAAIASIAGVILHIYMATAATPGALRGMIEGWVPPRWAAVHHPKWFKEISKR